MHPSAPPSRCHACKDGLKEPFPFTMAFQPIIDVEAERIFAYEALVRGPHNEPAAFVLGQVTEANRYAFDQTCRVKAITLAARLGIALQGAKLSVNFMPGAVYSPAACIQLTLKVANSCGLPLDRLIFEITEDERLLDPAHLMGIVQEYRKHGFQMALDDFGAGYAGLNLLSDFAADLIKLDRHLIHDLHRRPTARAVVVFLVQLCNSLNIALLAEGVETVEEFHAIRACGIRLMQGYLFARPAFESFPPFTIPTAPASLEHASHAAMSS